MSRCLFIQFMLNFILYTDHNSPSQDTNHIVQCAGCSQMKVERDEALAALNEMQDSCVELQAGKKRAEEELAP